MLSLFPAQNLYCNHDTQFYPQKSFLAKKILDHLKWFDKDLRQDEQMKIFTKDENVAMVYRNYYFKNEIKNTNKILYKNTQIEKY